jgi:hypothetical protein
MFALFVEIKDAHTQQTITMNAQIQMMLGKLVVCMVAMTANGGDWRSKSLALLSCLALHLMAFILPIACYAFVLFHKSIINK